MALRSPVEFHNFWGQFSLYSDLPNVAGSPTSSVNLQVGDVAYVTGTSLLYFCTTATVGGAVWASAGGGGGSSQDRFAPKYLVGNVANGDSNVAYNTDGFQYFPDPGDGTGIRDALIAASSPPGGVYGDVWIRPGTYNYNLSGGAIAGPLSIPSFVRVHGAGRSTIVRGLTGGDQGIFLMNEASQLANLLAHAYQSNSTTGSAGVVEVVGGSAVIDNVVVLMDPQPNKSLDTCILVSGPQGEDALEVLIRGCTMGTGFYGIRFGYASNCTVESCSVSTIRHAVLIDSTATKIRVVGSRLRSNSGFSYGVGPAAVFVDGDGANGRNVISSNTIESVGVSELYFAIGIQVLSNLNVCVGNNIEIADGTVAIDVSGDDNVIVSNVSGATTPVQNTGAGNEIAHNI